MPMFQLLAQKNECYLEISLISYSRKNFVSEKGPKASIFFALTSIYLGNSSIILGIKLFYCKYNASLRRL
jgi:hypothetical protein